MVLSSPASGVLWPPSNIPNTATEYAVPALRGKGNKSLLEQKTRCQNIKRNSGLTGRPSAAAKDFSVAFIFKGRTFK